MLTNQVIQNCIEELRSVSKIDLCVMDLSGSVVASTIERAEMFAAIVTEFAQSSADSQTNKGYHLFKVYDEKELTYILLANGNEDAYMIGKIAVGQLKQLLIAYKERFDKNGFFQNLVMDNLLLVDIYNRAKKLHIAATQRRVVILAYVEKGEDLEVTELLRGMFSQQGGDYLTSVEENEIVLVKSLGDKDGYLQVREIADTIVDMVNSEVMVNLRVSYGTIVDELKDISKSYKEAKMAMEVGSIFYADRIVNAYNTLGIGRLIYQLPLNLCRIFIKEIFGSSHLPEEIDDEILSTVQKFFENNLNISETSRQLFVHRNTLVYRIEKLQKVTGLDMRVFEDALTFSLALMVANYVKHLEEKEF